MYESIHYSREAGGVRVLLRDRRRAVEDFVYKLGPVHDCAESVERLYGKPRDGGIREVDDVRSLPH